MISSVVAGLGLGLSLIVAIGAQNLFLLRQGVRREHALLVAAICAVSDAALIAVGVSGLGAIISAAPWVIDVVRWAGFFFLLGYGLLAARRAWRPSGEALRVGADTAANTASAAGAATSTTTQTRSRVWAIVATTLALTWLNPHVYLDTLFLLGSVANTHGENRWWFAAGAIVASFAWFFSLAIGSRYLGPWLANPRAWRVLDAIIAVVMIAIAISLVWPS